MIKIDLHIHTVPSIYEPSFEFSLEKLKQYISKLGFDAIAITNHNLFDKEQYNCIADVVKCSVFPGVEVDIENSHLLVIGSTEKINELFVSCQQLTALIKSENDSITFKQFIEIFPNYRDYILIPHVDKKPAMKSTTLEKFGDTIRTGEVRSAKKFESAIKDMNSLVPVLFSDIRLDDEINVFPSRFTYVDINIVEYSVLKNALMDKTKVYISKNKLANEYAFLNDGTAASTKLNVIIGKRSSGKTYNLEQIQKSKDTSSENIKYIKQFSLTGNSEIDKFEGLVRKEQEDFINEYLAPLRMLIDKVLSINEYNSKTLDEYLDSLKEYASNQSLQDAYSKTKLFNESYFLINDNYDTKKVINAVDVLLNSEHNEDLIFKLISRNQLILLLMKLIERRKEELKELKLKKQVNTIVSVLKNKLSSKSSMRNITDINLYDIVKQKFIIKEFNRICNNLKKESLIFNLDVYRFKLQIRRKKFTNGSTLKKTIKTNKAIANVFNEYYANPYKYIQELSNVGIERTNIYKCMFDFEIKVLNDKGNPLSGGERAEYNLLRELKGAEHYDTLLIDEPEASFDNLFIKKYIIDIIKDLSQKTTVFITTHNNSLGMSIKPNKLIYTSHDEDGFKVYTGEVGCKYLSTVSDNKIISYDTIMEVMEAGSDAYDERQDIYESFKN